MKLATFSAGGQQRLGAIVADDSVAIDLARAEQALARREKRKAHAFFGDMLSLLEAGNKGLSAAKKAAKAAEATAARAAAKAANAAQAAAETKAAAYVFLLNSKVKERSVMFS